MRPPRAQSRLLWIALLVALAQLTICARSGHAQGAPSTISLTSSSPTLELPGTLTLTSAVNQPVIAGAVPIGNVSFFYDGTHSLGTAALKVLPSTQSFLASPPLAHSFGNNAYGLLTLKFPNAEQSVVGALDYYPQFNSQGVQTGLGPQLTVFSGFGSALFQTATAYQIANSNITDSGGGVDAVATGDFNHDGIPDVLIHGFASNFSGVTGANGDEYYVLLGQPDGTYNPTGQYTSIISTDTSGNLCDCALPTEVLSVGDFNGDGYDDVAYAGTGLTNGLVGIALNGGPSVNNSFSQFITAPALPSLNATQPFCATGIASGVFTASGHSDVAVVGGYSSSLNNGPRCSTMRGGYVVMYLGQGDGTLVLTSQMLTVGTHPSAIATADFNKDGDLDVAVANQGDGAVQVSFGDGTGKLAAPQAGNVIQVGPSPARLSVADFNGDGFPDILVSDSSDGTLRLALNDGTGHFPATAQVVATAAQPAVSIAQGDFNSDGLADIAVLTPPAPGSFASFAVGARAALPGRTSPFAAEITGGSVAALLNSASAQAVFTTAPQTLPAGAHTLTATFPGDANFSASASTGLAESVTQTPSTLIWNPPAAIAYGTALSSLQLNAMASVPGTIVYSPAAGTVLPPGPNTLTAVFTPADTFDFTSASATQTLTVLAQSAVATASAPATVNTGEQSAITLTIAPYPAPITATLTLSFTPAPPNTVADPSVLFSNNTMVETISIPANSTAPIAPINFQSGSTAGTITITTQLVAGGANVTPSTLVPVAVSVPAGPPSISSATMTRTGNSLQIVVLGLSPARDMAQAQFHFTAAPGKTLKTADLTVQLAAPFSGWYQTAASDAFGTTFSYTQPFTLDSPATDVGSVAVTLTNSKGSSQPTTVQ